MKSPRLLAWSLVTLALVTVAIAEEHKPADAMDVQPSWGALANQIKSADDKATEAHTRIDQMVECAKLNKLYTPGKFGADAHGCFDIQAKEEAAKAPPTPPAEVKDTRWRGLSHKEALGLFGNDLTAMTNFGTSSTNACGTVTGSFRAPVGQRCGPQGRMCAYNDTTAEHPEYYFYTCD